MKEKIRTYMGSMGLVISAFTVGQFYHSDTGRNGEYWLILILNTNNVSNVSIGKCSKMKTRVGMVRYHPLLS